MARYVVGNWKMNLLARDGIELAQAIRRSAESHPEVQVWIAPSFLSIPAISEVVKNSPLRIGSQTAHGEDKGAYTGEVSAAMLKEFGCTFALVGHSERRWVLGETDTVVSAKAAGLLRQDITPIFCVGESLEEYDRGITHEVLRIQLTALFDQLRAGELKKTIIAYEPCWAIGTGKVPTPEVIENVHGYIYNTCTSIFGEAPQAILYGGSVNGSNFAEILEIPQVDGGLVGGASLSAPSFAELIQIAASVQGN